MKKAKRQKKYKNSSNTSPKILNINNYNKNCQLVHAQFMVRAFCIAQQLVGAVQFVA